MSRPLVVVLAAAALALASGPLRAEFMPTTEVVPIERLVKNVSRKVDENPKDVRWRMVLARIHARAWAVGGQEGADKMHIEPAKKEGEPPTFAPWQTVRQSRGADKKPDKAAITHFHLAVHHYRKALEIEPKSALGHLGLGWVLDNGAQWAHLIKDPAGVEYKLRWKPGEREEIDAQVARAATAESKEDRDRARAWLLERLARVVRRVVDLVDHPERKAPFKKVCAELLTRHYQDLALAHFRKAFALRKDADLAQEYFGEEGDEAVAQEAGEALLRLLAGRKGDAIVQEREAIGKVVEVLKKKGRWVTPVVFPFDGRSSLADLTPRGRTTQFDLDGDDVVETWPWVTPDTGILVWAPDDRPITSGRQLFGSVTWWMLWKDGYAALEALDDDGDGRLTGSELTGLGVWRDSDGDGVSDPGEVRSVARHSIVSITARADHRHAGVPAARRGITFDDGRSAPTYDWTPHSVVQAD